MVKAFKVKRILVVDDQAGARKIISALMAAHGQVDLAENGQDALALYNEALQDGWAYDLVCLDVEMPGMLDGMKVVKCIRIHEDTLDIKDRVPIVIISAHQRPEDICAAKSLCGANEYIMKPFNRSRVNEAIQRYLYPQ